MIRGWQTIILAALTALLAGPAFADPARFGRCAVPQEIVADTAPLTQVAQALAAGAPLRIVAMGSTSSTGRGASSRDKSYVRLLAAELRKIWPQAQIEVVDAARESQTAEMMNERIGPDVLRLSPVLVVWETGTTDSIRHLDPTDFGDALESGIAALHAAGSDVILVTPQFSPVTAKLIDFSDFRDVMSRAASAQGVGILYRGEIMRQLFETKDMVLDGDSKSSETAVDAWNACLARLLADAIARSAATP